jgi:hypothetical protein
MTIMGMPLAGLRLLPSAPRYALRHARLHAAYSCRLLATDVTEVWLLGLLRLPLFRTLRVAM